MKFFSRQFVRFLLVGGANTVIGYGLYLLANHWLDYRWAYSLSYAAGIGISYLLNSWFVFREPLSLRKFIRFPLVYAVQYLAGLAIIWCLVSRLHLPESIAPLAVTALTVPLTYATSRLILQPRVRHEN